MHNCLLVEEILRMIIEAVFDDEDRFARASSQPFEGPQSVWGMPTLVSAQLECSRRSLAYLARSCRMFTEPALDALYSELQLMDPLIRCMPSDLWTVTSNPYSELVISLRRLPCEDDWRIFTKHAMRVRVLGTSKPGSLTCNLDGELISTLLTSPHVSQALLPRLEVLICPAWSGEYCHLLRRLINPNLTQFYSRTHTHKWSIPQLSVISSLGIQCVDMKVLHLRHGPADDDGTSVIVDVVCKWRHLQKLLIGAPTDKLIRHLPSLPSLRFLHLIIPENDIAPTRRKIDFPETLRVIHIEFVTYSSCKAFLENVYASPTRLHIISETWTPPTAIQDFISWLPQHFSPAHLEKLSFGADYRHPPVEDSSIISCKPIFVFSRLKSLDLGPLSTAKFDDAALEELAAGFPQLEALCLGNHYGWPYSPAITLGGLKNLLKHCRKLTQLSLPFNADVKCGLTPNHPLFVQLTPNDTITTLSVVNSGIGDPVRVAAVLSSFFPRLKSIRTTHDWTDEAGIRCARWKEVSDLLPMFAASREQGRALCLSGVTENC
ncbi:hypothetical protein BV22DRAFT_569287 [Leucogyrophana mollusca]|uniref:Uncharacterized protein n=1 Tax=Leucogyrophana mollusca TaxID=85980 RepID=A0ACB8BE97_9AGAM|nr:hypothetical protein BV22DRAFT_569287 [Leucogyrophana mollusca]